MTDTKSVEEVAMVTVTELRKRLSHLTSEEQVRTLKLLQDWCALRNDELRREVPEA